MQGSPDADNITELVLDTLSVKVGLSVEDLARKLVACSTDGASVMTGVHRGVAVQIGSVAPFSSNIHCMAHRTNLAAAALEKAPVVKEVIGVIKEVYNFFSHSAKRVDNFREAAEEAGTSGHRIKRIVETRWICARAPAQTLLGEYKALLRLFLDDEETKLYNELRNARHYVAMHALMPALVSLDMFVKLCQSRTLYVGELAKALQSLKARLREMYITPGTCYTTMEFGDYRELQVVGEGGWVLDPDHAEDGEERLGLDCGGGDWYPFTADPPPKKRDPTPLPLTPARLAEVVASVQKDVSAAITELLDELEIRFPPNELLEAMSIVYSEYWERKPTAADVKMKLEAIKKRYCCPRKAADGTEVPPLLNGRLLDQQAPSFITLVSELAKGQRLQRTREDTERQRQQSMAAADPTAPECKLAHRKLLSDTPTSRLWTTISNSVSMADSVTEFAALAQLVFVMVPGSVEDERRFSAMGYVQDSVRNRLHEHLGLCVRMFSQDLFDLRTFPFAEALTIWQEGATKRGRYMMNR